MKHIVRIDGENTPIDIDFGIKIGHSVYILCAHDSPHGKKDIIDIFMKSTLEKAVVVASSTEFFKETGFINLITGDGQVCRITREEVK